MDSWAVTSIRILSSINNWIDKHFGLRIQPSADTRLQRCREQLIVTHQIECIFDVGANIGQFAQSVREGGFTGRIVSFEPTNVFVRLQEEASRDINWLAYNVALSDTERKSVMHVASNNSLSSSLSHPKGIMSEFPIDFSSENSVEVKTLDSYKSVLMQRNYLKLDVQGHEYDVLRGAQSLLNRFEVIEFESALVQLYENERTFLEISSFLTGMGYTLVMIAPTHWSKRHNLISLDSIFVKADQ